MQQSLPKDRRQNGLAISPSDEKSFSIFWVITRMLLSLKLNFATCWTPRGVLKPLLSLAELWSVFKHDAVPTINSLIQNGEK